MMMFVARPHCKHTVYLKNTCTSESDTCYCGYPASRTIYFSLFYEGAANVIPSGLHWCHYLTLQYLLLFVVYLITVNLFFSVLCIGAGLV